MGNQGPVGNRLRQRIREERDRHGWTQIDLAQQMGVQPSLIAKIEVGDRAVHVGELSRFADIFGASVDALIGRSRGGELAWAASSLTSNAQKMAGEIERLQTRLRESYDDLRAAMGPGGTAVTNLLEITGSSILALSSAREWLNRLANQFPIPMG